MEQYESELLRFKLATPEFIEGAKKIGKLLHEKNIPAAKKLASEVIAKLKLVRWEALALADLAHIESEKLEIQP